MHGTSKRLCSSHWHIAIISSDEGFKDEGPKICQTRGSQQTKRELDLEANVSEPVSGGRTGMKKLPQIACKQVISTLERTGARNCHKVMCCVQAVMKATMLPGVNL